MSCSRAVQDPRASTDRSITSGEDLLDKYCSIFQIDVRALLIGDEDAVEVTAGLLQDALLRFGRVTIMKSSPERASDLLDIYTFHLVFFHLSSTQPPSKLETLQAMRNNVSQKPKKIIFVLVIPELYLDTAGKAADFLLTKPVTVDKLQMVFDGCEFLFQKGDDGSNCNAKPDSDSETVQKESQPHSPRRDPGPSVSERSEPHASPVVRAAPSPPLSPSEDLNCKLQALLHSRKEQRRRLQIKKCCDSLRDLLPFLKNQRIDTASVLEMTVKYMKYLQRKVPQGILSKGVVKAIEEDKTREWYNPVKPPISKRKYTRKQGKSKDDMVTDAQIDSDIVDDFIAANVLGRSIKPASERPSNEVMVVVSQLLPEAQLCPAVVPWPSYPPQQPPDIFHASAPPLPSFSTFANLNNSYSVLQNAGAGIPFSSEWPNQCEMGYENPFLPFPGANMPAFALSSSSPQPPRNTGFNPHEQHCSGVTVVKEMEQDQAEEWCKPFNPPKKRKFIKKKSPKSKDHPVTDSQIYLDIDDFIAANVLGRCIKPASERPSNDIVVVSQQAAKGLLPDAQSCPAVVPWPGYPHQQPPEIFHTSAPPLPSYSTFANLNNSYSMQQNPGPGIPFSSEWPSPYELGYENPFLPFPGANMPACVPYPPATESSLPYRPQACILSSSSPQPLESRGFSPYEQHCSGHNIPDLLTLDSFEDFSEETMRNQELFQRSSLQENPFP